MNRSHSQMKDCHRKLLQHFMCKGLLDSRELKAIYNKMKAQYPDDMTGENGLADALKTISASITDFNLEIKQSYEERDGAVFHCLVNTVETPISRLSSTYTLAELELFKKMVQQIVLSEDGKIGSLAALKLTDKLDKKMGIEEAENFMVHLEKNRWIVKDQSGKISLSGRSIVELEQYLKEVYPDDVKMCFVCSKLVLLGEICSFCGIKIHIKCARSLFAQQGDENHRCPARNCRSPWESEAS